MALPQIVRLRESFLKFSDQKKKKTNKQPNRKIELSFYSIYTISDKTIVIERYGQITSNQNKIEF